MNKIAMMTTEKLNDEIRKFFWLRSKVLGTPCFSIKRREIFKKIVRRCDILLAELCKEKREREERKLRDRARISTARENSGGAVVML